MTQERAQFLMDTAERLSQALPLDQRDRFKVDFLKVMGDLNDTIDTHMNELEVGIVELLLATFPTSPGPVNETTVKVVSDAKAIIYAFHLMMAEIDVPSIRQLIYSAVQKSVTASYTAAQKNEENARERTSRTKELC